MVDFPAAKTGILPYIEDWKTRVNEGMKKLETTVQYSAAFAAFWAIDCTVIGYASVFLQMTIPIRLLVSFCLLRTCFPSPFKSVRRILLTVLKS